MVMNICKKKHGREMIMRKEELYNMRGFKRKRESNSMQYIIIIDI